MALNSEYQKNEESSVQLVETKQFMTKWLVGTDIKEISILIVYTKAIIVVLKEIEFWIG